MTSFIDSKFKVIIVGDGKVGKTHFVKTINRTDFSSSYIPTKGVDVSKLKFDNVILDIWDCGGSPGHKGLEDSYYLNANAAIVMFDFTNLSSYQNVSSHIKSITRVCENIPIIICGNNYKQNKIQCVNTKDLLRFIHRTRRSYYNISVNDMYNIDKPFNEIVKKYYKPRDQEEFHTINLNESSSLSSLNKEINQNHCCTIL